MDFSNLKVVEKTHKRFSAGGNTQSYDNLRFKMKKNDENNQGRFFFSDKLFNELEMEDNCLQLLIAPDKRVYLALISESKLDEEGVEVDGVFAKRRKMKDGSVTKKGKNFANIFLQEGLVDLNIISTDILVSQYLDVTKVEDVTSLPDYILGIYEVTAGTSNASASDEDEDDIEEGTDENEEEVDFD